MGFFKKNPRRTLILGLYVGLFIVAGFIFSVTAPVLIMLYLLMTLILMAVYYADCAAVAGNLHYGRGETEKSLKFLRFAIKHHTKSPAAHLNYAIYLMRQGSAREAHLLLETAMTLNPSPIAMKNLQLTQGTCLWVMGDIDAAVDHLERMRRQYDYVNPQVLSTLGYLYYLQGHLDKAETLSQAALDDKPETSAAWDNLGQICFAKNDLARAKEHFTKALEYKNDLPDSLYYLGLIAQREGQAEQAADYYNKALACTITAMNTVSRPQIEQALAALAE